MRIKTIVGMIFSGLVVLTGAIGDFGLAEAQTDSAASRVLARTIELSGRVVLHHQGLARPLVQWDLLYAGDTLELAADAMTRITLPDGRLLEAAGPKVLVVQPKSLADGASVLGQLSAAARALVFGKPPAERDRPMAVREVSDSGVRPLMVPRLLRPYAGELLPAEILEFSWEPVAGIDLYSLSLYNSGGLIWKTTTSSHRVRCPAELLTLLAKEQKYFWQVEAISGGCVLPSRSSAFQVIDPLVMDSIRAVSGELAKACTDATSKRVVEAEAMIQAGYFSMALETLQPTGQAEDDMRILSCRARLLELLGDEIALLELVPELLAPLRQTPSTP